MSLTTSGNGSRPAILVVDDDEIMLATLARMLGGLEHSVETYATAEEAIERVKEGGVEVVVSDIVMPALTGLELLRAVREHDPDLPVLLVTGTPAIDTAIAAVEVGAFRYLVKPVAPATLRSVVARAVQVYRLALMKREALSIIGQVRPPSDRVGLEVSFERALDGLWMAFQPILKSADGETFGYEALLRSEEPSLPGPMQVVEAAERLDALFRLGRAVRRRAAQPMLEAENAHVLFVNLHPHELFDDDLFSSESALGRMAKRVVLEVTERASLHGINGIQSRISRLREMGYRIAVDDLGAGYAGLASFALLEPDVVKLDVSLVRDIDTSAVKQKVVRSITALCRDMGLLVVAEGIETRPERDVLIGLGCPLVQGFYFARPGKPFPLPTF